MKREQQHIQASVLDRLIDDEPTSAREPVQSRASSIGQVKAVVARDLERLLNTKGPIAPAPASYRYVNDSLYTYGITDFTAENPKSLAVRQRLRQEIETAIARFEPRLRNVTVRVDGPSTSERNLRFKITALLKVEPLTEPVTFDTFFDVNRGEYLVSK